MIGRRTDLSPKCVTPTSLTTTYRLTLRRRSHANAHAAPKSDVGAQQMHRAQSPYSVVFRHSLSKPRRKGSLGMRSGPKPVSQKKGESSRHRNVANLSTLRPTNESETCRRKARTPSPTFFSLLPKMKGHNTAKTGKKKGMGETAIRISMENVLQTPGEEETGEMTAALYTTLLEKSLEQYMQCQPGLKSLLHIPPTSPQARASQVEPEPAAKFLDAPTAYGAHRRLYLSTEGKQRSLTPTPPCS